MGVKGHLSITETIHWHVTGAHICISTSPSQNKWKSSKVFNSNGTQGDIFVELQMALIDSDVIWFESGIQLKPSASEFSVPGMKSKFARSAIHLWL